MVAMFMMSVPGIATHSVDVAPLPILHPSIAPANPVAAQPPAKKKLSFFRRPAGTGIASWYGTFFQGRKTANGETFDQNQMTACHKTLPFGTLVRVVDLKSGKSVIVRINDRGALLRERVIDLSRGAAEKLGIGAKGLANVRLEVVTKRQVAPEELAATHAPASLAAEATSTP